LTSELRHEFIASELAVLIAVEFLESCHRVLDFFCRDFAITIGIQGCDNRQHQQPGTSPAATRSRLTWPSRLTRLSSLARTWLTWPLRLLGVGGLCVAGEQEDTCDRQDIFCHLCFPWKKGAP
jgi:hypothetical protein